MLAQRVLTKEEHFENSLPVTVIGTWLRILRFGLYKRRSMKTTRVAISIQLFCL